LHGYETWPHTLREKQKLRFFENRVPRKIFWPNIHPENEMGRAGTTYEGKERRVKDVVEKPKGRRPTGRQA
jgi:hypothetical protein